MRVIIQRVKNAEVKISNQVFSAINHGFLILLGIEDRDEKEDAEWLVRKISAMRIFSDNEGKMNLDIKQVNGSFLVISQFTLFASTQKGNRPSFIRSARPDKAIPLYEYFLAFLSQESGIQPATGQFGADMQVSLLNDGPVTIWMDSRNREY